ncbi:MAG: DUF6702 family protein [Pirellulales bacterium]
MNILRVIFSLSCLWVACVGLTSTCSAGHPYHTSSAELDWNADSKRWEVALRIHGGDLELALARQFGKRVDIESEQAQELMVDYLTTRLRFLPQSVAEKLKENHQLFTSQPNSKSNSTTKPTSAGASSAEVSADSRSDKAANKPDAKSEAKVHWVGSELEGTWMWLYFEISTTESSEETVLMSQLLTEVNEDQINIISVRYQGKRVTRQTGRSQLWISFQ